MNMRISQVLTLTSVLLVLASCASKDSGKVSVATGKSPTPSAGNDVVPTADPTVASQLIDTTVTGTGTVRQPKDLANPETGVVETVMAKVTALPKGTKVQIQSDKRLQRQKILNADGSKFTSYTKPFYQVYLTGKPADLDADEWSKISGQVYYLSVSDLDPANLVAKIFSEPLPPKADRASGKLPWDGYNPQGTWSYYISQALDKDANNHLVSNPPSDITEFCPAYKDLNETKRKFFWSALISQIADLESDFLPMTSSDESVFNPAMKGIFSTGLTQLSIGSTGDSCYQARGCSEIKSNDDLENPRKHFACAVAVMSCLVSKDQCISCKSADDEEKWLGIAKYWSTLQAPHEKPCRDCASGKTTVGRKAIIIDQIKDYVPFCAKASDPTQD